MLLLAAIIFAYAGFAGGEVIGNWLVPPTPLSLETERVRPGDHQLEEDDDDADDENDMDTLMFPQLLHDYYKKHNPALLGDVPTILGRYAGREQELFAKLEKKYGEPVVSKMNNKKVEATSASSGDKPSKGSPSKVRNRNEQDDAYGNIEDTLQADEEEDDEATRAIENDVEEEGDEEEEEDGETQAIGSQHDGSGHAEETDEEEEEEEDAAGLAPDRGFDANQEDLLTSGDALAANRGNVKVIVVGFPGTGVEHVSQFLRAGLGMDTDNEEESCSLLRNLMGYRGIPEFKRFDKWEVIANECAAAFVDELIVTYPSAKVVITVRDVDEWYSDMSSRWTALQSNPLFLLRLPVFELLAGSTSSSTEYLWKKKYALFYERVFALVGRNKRKLMPVFSRESAKGEGWKWLAHFVAGQAAKIDRQWKPPQLASPASLRPVASQVVDAMAKLHVTRLHSTEGKSISLPNGRLKVIGVGLDGTGSEALSAALKKLGYSVVSHWYGSGPGFSSTCTSAACKAVVSNVHKVINGENNRPNFGLNGVFHGVDAVVGAPADLFVQETLKYNPDVKVIFMARNLDEWWSVIKCKWPKWSAARKSRGGNSRKDPQALEALLFHSAVYGLDETVEYMFKKRYREHLGLLRDIPADKLLVIDLSRTGPAGDAWRQLCDLLRLQTCTSRLQSSRFPLVSQC